jgi:hypothetical protein
VPRQVAALEDRRVARQVVGRAIHVQPERGQARHHIAPGIGSIERHAQVGFAAGQVGEARLHQQVHRQVGIVLQEARQQRGNEAHAQRFRYAQAHHAADRDLGAGQLPLRRQHRAFHRLGVRQHGVPHLRQLITFARAVEQGRAQLLLQAVDAARDGGVLHFQPARGAGQGAGARQLQEEAQVGPFGQCFHAGYCASFSSALVLLCKFAHTVGAASGSPFGAFLAHCTLL